MPCGDVIRAAKQKATADMLDISRLHNLQTVAQPASLAQGRVPFVAEAAGTGVSRCLLWMQAAQMHRIGDRDQPAVQRCAWQVRAVRLEVVHTESSSNS